MNKLTKMKFSIFLLVSIFLTHEDAYSSEEAVNNEADRVLVESVGMSCALDAELYQDCYNINQTTCEAVMLPALRKCSSDSADYELKNGVDYTYPAVDNPSEIAICIDVNFINSLIDMGVVIPDSC